MPRVGTDFLIERVQAQASVTLPTLLPAIANLKEAIGFTFRSF